MNIKKCFLTKRGVKAWKRLPKADTTPLEGFRDVQMQHIETWLSGGLGSAGLTVHYHKGLFQSKQFCDSMRAITRQGGACGAPGRAQKGPSLRPALLLMPTEPRCKAQGSARSARAQGNRNHQGAQTRASEGEWSLGCCLGGFTGILRSPNFQHCLWVLLKDKQYNLLLG